MGYITFACPSCSSEITTNETYAGKSARCPHCSREINIPDPNPKPEPVRELKDFIITTTPTVEGKTIQAYLGIVAYEAISGVNLLKFLSASVRNAVGGRATSYEGELEKTRQMALDGMGFKAQEMGGNAVIAAKMDYEVFGERNDMLLVSAYGTAVKLS